MSYLTAIKTSFKNLLTKKGRTILTAFAGSIGIIGIALVLSISSGMTTYTNNLQSDALAGFPITISSIVETDSFGPPAGTPFGDPIENDFPDGDILYAYDSDAARSVHVNDINETFIDYLNAMDTSFYNSISYSRSIALNIVDQSSIGNYIRIPTRATGSFF